MIQLVYSSHWKVPPKICGSTIAQKSFTTQNLLLQFVSSRQLEFELAPSSNQVSPSICVYHLPLIRAVLIPLLIQLQVDHMISHCHEVHAQITEPTYIDVY